MPTKSKTNTTKSIAASSVSNSELNAQIKKAGDLFKDEKLVKVAVPTALKPKIGDVLPVGINGVKIVIPVDGEDHAIPESFAAHVKDYLKNIK